VGGQVEQELTSLTRFGDLPVGWDLPRTGRLMIRTPLPLRPVAQSHGWSGLAPCAWDGTALHRTLAAPTPVTVRITQARDGLSVSWGGSADKPLLRAQVRHLLGVDDDLSELRATAPPWLIERGMGRLLRSPTVWEDLARTLATTNCSWALTRLMVQRLVDTLGDVGPHGERAFPTAQAVRDAGEDHLREVIKAGYRARSFVELATSVGEGSLGEQRWLSPELTDAEVEAEVLALRGFGPYAAEGMLGLLGRPKGFALDSWIRAKLPELLGVQRMTDTEIKARYEVHGRWAGSVLWAELTRDW
jgi:3-methyladenine DNA glycosylase/8-oxoguanine DNA glycosylase